MAYQYGGYGGQPSYDHSNQRQSGGQQQFQAAPNYSAPAMRAGGDGRRDQQGFGDFGERRYDNRGSRPGLGADQGGRNLERDRQQLRENMLAQQPPTREEIARTIFVGGIGENAPPDDALKAILSSAGKLRRWTRAKDSQDVKCRFGFAEYEDVDSLEAAKELFGQGIEVYAFKDGKVIMREGEDAGPEMLKLLVVIDEQSLNYIDEWMGKRNESEQAKQFRIETAEEELSQCMARLLNGDAYTANGFDMEMAGNDFNGAAPDYAGEADGHEDELADIPAEMRATVAQEIKNFRDRSTRRDLERITLEQDSIKPANRLASPGPQSHTNGSRGVAGAPSGPKGYRAAQTNGMVELPPEDESDASDTELERRREARKKEELETRYEEAEHRWRTREKTRANAVERERVREEVIERDMVRGRDALARKLEEFDDDEENKAGHEEYYYDRSNWHRKRQGRKTREQYEDDIDRKAEQRDAEAEQQRLAASHGAADRFLAETGAELAARQEEPAGAAFKISLGGLGIRKPTTQPRRTIADMAGLLEEEEDAAASGQPQREMRAIFKANVAVTGGAEMSEEERASARQALAADIPMDAEKLFDRKVYWGHIGSELLEKEIRPFVERKIIEALGLQEDFLVELVMSGLKEHTTPRKLIKDLEQVLDDEAEGLVRKVWRLVVYFGEAKEGGLV